MEASPANHDGLKTQLNSISLLEQSPFLRFYTASAISRRWILKANVGLRADFDH
jgi:hypothetical protein